MKRVAVVLMLLLLAGCASSKANGEAQPLMPVASAGPSPTSQPSTPIRQSIARGVKFILDSQNPDGSWGTGLQTRGYEVYSMVPGSHDAFRVATTALCVMALREVGGHPEAHARGVEYLVADGKAHRDAGRLLYNIWAHTYGLQALSIELKHDPKNERMRAAALWHLDRLRRYETYIGGWNYYDFEAQTQAPSMEPTSFGTAAALVALHEAKGAGLEVPSVMSGRAIRRLEEQRVPGGAYLYSRSHLYRPRQSANRTRGSVGRTQSCNYALWLWGSPKIGKTEVREGLEMFFAEHPYIEMGRKRQYPHESWYQTAPYYYYFGHYYSGLLLEKLGPAGREKYGARLAEKIVPKQDPDGAWWDYAMWDYHKPYGTAFAVMTLLRCEDLGGDLKRGATVAN